MSPVETWELYLHVCVDPDHPLSNQTHFKGATQGNSPGFLNGWWKILLSGGTHEAGNPISITSTPGDTKEPLLPTEEYLTLKEGSSALSFGDFPERHVLGWTHICSQRPFQRGQWRLLSRLQEHSKLSNFLCFVPDVKQIVLCSKSNPPHPQKISVCVNHTFKWISRDHLQLSGLWSQAVNMQCFLGTE